MHETETYPPCSWCGDPLSENERDHESGLFFSAHWRCVQPQLGGEFFVVSLLDGKVYRPKSQDARRRWGYTTLARANAQAQYWAETNSRRWDFEVYDREHSSPCSTFSGLLPVQA